MMQVLHVLLLLSLLATGNSINRPVVKIVLNQKGYAQFIQYDVEIPPMREFTLCTWVRFGDLVGDQTIFSYVGSGSTRIIRVWLEGGEGGGLQQLRVALDSRASSSTAVQFTPGVWHHLCLSYQSDYGAWALYIDSRLVFCQASHKLLGYIIPGGGRLIIGYGTSEKGTPNGLEGQIFGASMILYSTIERNYTLKVDPQYEQKPFRKNYLKDKNNHDNRYIILGDLQTGEIRSNLQEITFPNRYNQSQSFIHFTTPHSYVDHDVGIELASGNPKQSTSSTEKEILDIEDTDNFKSTENVNRVSFWSLVNKSEKPKMNHTKSGPTESGTRDLAKVFEYETPPSVTAPESDYSNKELKMQKHSFLANINNKIPDSYGKDTISEMETPPPPGEKPQVYGQWTNSKFVGNVLKYLKSINFNRNRQSNKVPSTIPLVHLSDSFPYASEFEHAKIRPPIKFNRKRFSSKHHILKKRDTNQPQINLQVVETDIRSEILKSHSETQPKHVEVTNRGEAKHNVDNRHYRHAESYTDLLESLGSLQITPNLSNGQPFSVASSRKKQILLSNLERHRGSNIMTILPFLKSDEYFEYNKNNETKEIETDSMYSKSFANANKWHNVKSYSNDYTPRRIDLEAGGKNPIDVKIAEANKKQPSIKFKYNHDDHKLVNAKTDVSIERGRALAEEVSNQANEQHSLYSIFKYNHGYLPGHDRKTKSKDKINSFSKSSSKTKKKDDFNKNVKLGNALNERDIIGRDENESKKSFIGGHDEIPDINKYRSQGENTVETVPPSLGPKVCKNVELYDRVMYVQPDGSIDMSHIFSPVREKNIGIEFIIQNYKRCSMQDSILQKNPHLLIDWSKTPVKLFGGAYPRQTKDLCGFF